MADRLDRHNQAYIRENARLKTQFKTQEDDRAYLIRQLVAAKKDNGRLRQELTRVKNELGDVQRQMRAGPAADVRVCCARDVVPSHCSRTCAHRCRALASPEQRVQTQRPQPRHDWQRCSVTRRTL